MNFYLLICDPAVEALKAAPGAKMLRAGLFTISDERDFISLHLALAGTGEFSPGCVLLELQNPFESAGLARRAQHQWEFAMLGATQNTIQSLGEETLRELKAASEQKRRPE